MNFFDMSVSGAFRVLRESAAIKKCGKIPVLILRPAPKPRSEGTTKPLADRQKCLPFKNKK
jgi:hypothetical protein